MKRTYMILLLVLLPVLVRAQRPAYQKMSQMVRGIAMMESSRAHRVPSALQAPWQDGRRLTAFVRTDGPTDALWADYGCRSLAKAGSVAIVSIPLGRLSALSNDSRVCRIEANRSAHILMDSTALHLHALPVYEGTALPQAYTGQDVVAGVQDIGFDLTHPNFYSADLGIYRIKQFWDQLSLDTLGSSLYVGADYTDEASLLAYAHSRDGEDQTHGTHTLGIMAGSGYNSPYRGMAPESDICIVANAASEDRPFIDEADLYKYTYATDVLGFKYIFDYADRVGKPCVISFSEGSGQDFRGDDVLYYEMLDSLLGPGHILVASAGNDGQQLTYVHKAKGRPSAGTFIYTTIDQVYFTLKSDAPFTLRTVAYGAQNDTISITSDAVCAAPDSLLTDSVTVGNTWFKYTIAGYPSSYNSQEMAYEVIIRCMGRLGTDFPVSLELVGEAAEADLYLGSGYLTGNEKNPSLADGEARYSINSPSSAPRVICVGATSYRHQFTNYEGTFIPSDFGRNGERAAYSSVGPTFDGRIKPDVMAPGSNIISSYSSYYLAKHPTANDIRSDVAHFDFNGRTYAWNANTGTSMSSPALGGVVALWLQARPDLTPEDVMDVFRHTCRQPDPSLTYPNNLYGYGEADAYRGLLYLLGIDGIKDISRSQPAQVSVRPAADGRISLRLSSPAKKNFTVRLYTTGGHQLAIHRLAAGAAAYLLPAPHGYRGVLVVQVDGYDAATTGSTLIRL